MTADNAVRIGHGCEVAGGGTLPVIAQSVLFPTVAPVLSSSDGAPVPNLDAVITQGSLAGLSRLVQDQSIFMSQEVKRDALGNSIGFTSSDGSLSVDHLGRVPFQFVGPRFVATSCAKRLLIRLAVADVCSINAGETVAEGKVNLWIPDDASQYATAGKANGVDGIGSPPALIVTRDLSANPLPPACGAGVDVTVMPSAADVNANLAIPGVWGFGATDPAQPVRVVEYYHAQFDHYFITWVPDEIAKLDDGVVLRGWARTGRVLRAFKAAQQGTSPVCRYYIPPALGDSHFYGRGTAECNATGQSHPSFVLEDPQFLQMVLPTLGNCPAGMKQVYRVFSNRVDANHRYLTDKLTRTDMVAQGWLVEGDGPDSVVMCAPQ